MAIEGNFADLMDTLSVQTQKFAVPDTKTRTAMTTAGAEVFEKALHKNTPRSNRKNEKYGHLQDNIMSQSTNIDGLVDGSAVVGFGEKAYVARFLNDGTVKMPATHFVDNTRMQSAKAVLAAEQAVFAAMHGGGGQ